MGIQDNKTLEVIQLIINQMCKAAVSGDTIQNDKLANSS